MREEESPSLPDGLVVSSEGGVLTLELSRPDRLNAVTTSVLEVMAASVEAAADADEHVIVLRGAGRAFCSGADLEAGDGDQASASTIDAANRLVRAILETPCTVVAVVQGGAAGVGASMAFAADICLAAEDAYFLLAFARVGLMPDGGATALVTAAAGRNVALRLALLAERLPASEAAGLGLVTRTCEDLFAESESVVAALAAGPRRALSRTKWAVNAVALAGIDAALDRERAGQVELLASPDYAEGTAAFFARRPPEFSDRP